MLIPHTEILKTLTIKMKKVLIINGHPDSESFCFGLHESYKKGSLQAGNEVKEIILANMAFNPILMHGYRKRTDLEPDLLEAWEKIKWAEHIVWIYPTWWASPPGRCGFPAPEGDRPAGRSCARRA